MQISVYNSRYSIEPITGWASGEVAERWSRNQARRNEIYQEATELMLDLAQVNNRNTSARYSCWHGRTDAVGGSTGRAAWLRFGY